MDGWAGGYVGWFLGVRLSVMYLWRVFFFLFFLFYLHHDTLIPPEYFRGIQSGFREKLRFTVLRDVYYFWDLVTVLVILAVSGMGVFNADCPGVTRSFLNQQDKCPSIRTDSYSLFHQGRERMNSHRYTHDLLPSRHGRFSIQQVVNMQTLSTIQVPNEVNSTKKQKRHYSPVLVYLFPRERENDEFETI